MAGKRYAIIGDGAAGMTAAETLRRLDPKGAITVVSDDPHPTYFRAALTNYLLGELRDEQIWAVPPSHYRELRVERVFARVAAVDTGASLLKLTNGAALPYESLLIATGSRARQAPFEGADLAGVVTLRTLQDARAVMDAIVLDGLRSAVVIGGGPLALEWAHAMRERGAAVTMIVREGKLMTGTLDAAASDLVLARLRMGGIEVRAGEEVEAAVAGPNGRVVAVRTRSGATIACELVAVAIGVACNTELLEGSGIALGARGGVIVDARLRTSAANVFAAGDVAEVGGRLLQLWEPARAAAQVAAVNMAGGDTVYAPGAHYFATRLYDLDFASVGVIHPIEASEVIVDNPRRTGKIAYRKLVIAGGRLVGALMVGDRDAGVRRRGRLYKRLVDEFADVSAIRDDLLDPAFDLRGFLDTRALVERPPPARPAAQSTAALRGTQRLAIGSLTAPQAVTPSKAPSIGGTVKAGPMLTIGLKLANVAAPQVEGEKAAAYVEVLGRRFPLERESMGIGRRAPADVVVEDPLVSSLHAQLLRHDDAWFLRDAGSRNGTWVNDALVTLPYPLRDGDRIRVGTTDLVFHSATSPPRPARGAQPNTEPMAFVPGPAGSAAPPILEIRSGPGFGLRFALIGPQVTAGRDAASAVRLDHRSVSRRHAVFAEHDGGWFVSDLHSTFGTFKNSERLTPGEDTPLADGDTLKLGDVVLVYTRP